MPAAKQDSSDPLKGKKDDENVWVENLRTGDSVYRSDRTKDNYKMTGNGLVGSVISVPVKVAKEASFRRNFTRGVTRLLTDKDAQAREEDLVFRDEGESQHDRTMQALEKGASDVGSRYTKKGLSDDGTEGQAISAKQIWKRESNKGPSSVRRSDIKAEPLASDEIPDGPMPAIVTDTVHEGEWQSDTGN